MFLKYYTKHITSYYVVKVDRDIFLNTVNKT